MGEMTPIPPHLHPNHIFPQAFEEVLLQKEDQVKKTDNPAKPDTTQQTSDTQLNTPATSAGTLQTTPTSELPASIPLWALKKMSAEKDMDPDVLARFVKLKNSPVDAERWSVLKEFGPHNLGLENWVIGLVAMMHDSRNRDQTFIAGMISRLGQNLKKLDIFFVISILKGFVAQMDLYNKGIIKKVEGFILDREFTSKISDQNLDKYSREQVKNLVITLLKGVGREDLIARFLKAIGEKPPQLVTPRFGGATMIEEQIARNQKEIRDKIYLQNTQPSRVMKEIYAAILASTVASVLLSRPIFNTLIQTPAMMYALIYTPQVDFLISPENRTLDDTKIALVTDYPIPEALLHLPGIEVVEQDPIHRIRVFFDKFRELLNKGFGTMLVILPDSKFWTSCYFARHAATDMEHRIKIIDSKTYGLGLTILIQETANLIFRHTIRNNIEFHVKQMISALRYWVVPGNTEVVKTKLWYRRMIRKIKTGKTPAPADIPVLAFHDPIELAAVAPGFKEGLDTVYRLIAQLLAQSDRKYKKAIIQYKTEKSEAERFARWLKTDYPELTVSLVRADIPVANEFGTHIGVCIL